MTTKLDRLKSAKGAPPPVDATPDVIADDPRATPEPEKALQFRVPKSVHDAFGEEAGKRFGFSHGSKKRLFMELWNTYKAQTRNS